MGATALMGIILGLLQVISTASQRGVNFFDDLWCER